MRYRECQYVLFPVFRLRMILLLLSAMPFCSPSFDSAEGSLQSCAPAGAQIVFQLYHLTDELERTVSLNYRSTCITRMLIWQTGCYEVLPSRVEMVAFAMRPRHSEIACKQLYHSADLAAYLQLCLLIKTTCKKCQEESGSNLDRS